MDSGEVGSISYLPDFLECTREGREHLEWDILHSERFNDEL